MKKLIIRILRLFGLYNEPDPKTPDTNTNQPVVTPPIEEETNTTSDPMENDNTLDGNKPTVHALLVSIDNYPIPHHRLNGCVNDRNAFEDFLKRRVDQTTYNYNLKLLTDAEASKQAIIDAFSHFEQAKDGDTCVFYFSGHGSRANSPKEFWHLDPDRMHESLVCHDSRIEGGKDLMDKELSYLFWKASNNKNLHFVAVFDCCHSGTITRNLILPQAQNQFITERMAEPSPVPNRLEDYYGFKSYISVEDTNGLNITPPSGKIVQISGSKDDETAKELKIGGTTRGVFTYNLIDILEKTNSQITYNELIRTLQMRVGSAVSKQTPQLITENTDQGNSTFLGGKLHDLPPYYTINYNNDEWVMFAGLIQGIPNQGGTVALENGTNVAIKSVEANRSILEPIDGLDQSKPHRVYASSLGFNKLKIAFVGDVSQAAKDTMQEAFEAESREFIELLPDPNQAQYHIQVVGDAFRLTLPGQNYPLFKSVRPIDTDRADFFLDQVERVAKWNNLKELQNPRTSIQDNELEIKLYRITEIGNQEDDAPSELVDWRERNIFSYGFKDNEWHQPSFRLSIKNVGQRTLYASALDLQPTFGITNKFLRIKELTPGGEEVWLIDFFENFAYKTIPLTLENEYLSWGISEISEFFKLIVSTDPRLQTDNYNQDALELEFNPDFQTKRAGRKRSKQPVGHDWKTIDIELNVIRPQESIELPAGRSTDLLNGNVSVTMPEGVSASASFSSQKEATRAVTDQFNSFDVAAKAPSSLWGAMNASSDFTFETGERGASQLNVLELANIQGADLINADNPIKLKLAEKLNEDEYVVPMGYDAETGLYYMLGSSNEKGEVVIEQLPEQTATRSLFRSVKLFFHKVVLAPLGFAYNWPQLAMADMKSKDEFDYVKDADRIKEKVASATKIVVMAHGIIGNTKLYPQSLHYLEDAQGNSVDNPYDLILTFDYENLDTDIRETARMFKKRLEEVGLDEGHGKDLTIIAHSMGGLVSRWMIEKEGGSALVTRLIMCGTPNNGSPWANVQELVTVLMSKVLNGVVIAKPYILPLMILKKVGKRLFNTLQQMNSDSDFMKELNDGTDPGIPYSIVMGNTSLEVTEQDDEIEKLIKKLAKKFVDLTYDSLTEFLFGSPNDIAVSKSSATEINGSENWAMPYNKYEVPCDHLQYYIMNAGWKGIGEAIISE
ncbi:MAG: caspase family protein [Bacteroidota bacterium]